MYAISLFCSGNGAGIQSWVPLWEEGGESSSPQELTLKLRVFRLGRQQEPIKTGDKDGKLMRWPEESGGEGDQQRDSLPKHRGLWEGCK